MIAYVKLLIANSYIPGLDVPQGTVQEADDMGLSGKGCPQRSLS